MFLGYFSCCNFFSSISDAWSSKFSSKDHNTASRKTVKVKKNCWGGDRPPFNIENHQRHFTASPSKILVLILPYRSSEKPFLILPIIYLSPTLMRFFAGRFYSFTIQLLSYANRFTSSAKIHYYRNTPLVSLM